jgi:hypothetical protein
MLPPTSAIDAINGPITDVTVRASIHESDGSTVFKSSENIGLISGGVSLDQTRDERRSFDLVLENIDSALTPGPTKLWYDKIIKIWRGVNYNGGTWERQLGEFFIDNISTQDFPHTVSINGRDRTKVLLKSKFPRAVTFPNNHPIEEIVRTIALNGGVPTSRISLPLTGKSTQREFTFDAQTERWRAIKEICTSYGFSAFFTGPGMLTMEAHADPALGIPEHTFLTGPQSGSLIGNLASYTKSLTDSRLYNHIVVTGEDPGTKLPIVREARNTNPGSPTRIARIGERSFFYTSSFITNGTQAQNVANNFRSVYAMESFDLQMDAIVAPWLEPGIVVEFIDPNPGSGDPTKFLLNDITIPLDLKSMSASARRITVVS